MRGRHVYTLPANCDGKGLGFGRDAAFTKDWEFSALVEHGGKRILFDTGNDASIWR